jgi:hypothetical protein
MSGRLDKKSDTLRRFCARRQREGKRDFALAREISISHAKATISRK